MNHRAHRGASRYTEKTNDHKEIMRRFALEEHKLAKFLVYLILFSFTSLCANCTKNILNHRAHRGASRCIEKTNDHKEFMRRCALEKHKLSKFLVYLILFSFTSLCVKIIFEPQSAPRRFALHRENK